MKRTVQKLFTLSLLLASFGMHAQKVPNPQPYAKTITAEDLKKHLYIIASKEMEGRETGRPGQHKAAAYIEGEMKRIGLEPANNGSYQLPYNLYQDSLVDATIEVAGQSFALDKDFNPALSNIAASMRFSEVVAISSVTATEVKAANLAGKLVLLVNSTAATEVNMQQLQAKGASMIFVVSSLFPKGNASARKGRQTVHLFKTAIGPQYCTISENIAKAITGNNWDEVKKAPTPITYFPAEVLVQLSKATISLPASNVMGMIKGTDKVDEYLFITAHYDHLGKRDSIIYYGADDDGSGTVGVLEIAEAFAKAKAAGKGPKRTVVFMTVSGEEKGLLGSEFYSMHPVFPQEKTTADLNIDMIGRSDASRKQGDSTNYVYVVGDDKLSSDLRTISESINNKHIKMELDYKFNAPSDPMRIYYRSDHYNFAKKGVPIIFYYDGMLGADYHNPTDTPDKINYQLMAKRAQLVFYTGWEMANRTEMLKRDIPLDTSVFTR